MEQAVQPPINLNKKRTHRTNAQYDVSFKKFTENFVIYSKNIYVYALHFVFSFIISNCFNKLNKKYKLIIY